MVDEKVAKRLTKVGKNKVKIGSNNYEGGENEGREFTGRDEKIVIDLVNVKIRIIDREERELRKNYHKEWTRLEDLVKKNSKEWRRLKAAVGA